AGPPAARNTDRLVGRQFLSVADQLDSLLERLLHRDTLELLAGRRLGALLDERAAAEVDGIHAECLGELVHVLLERPADLRCRRCADRRRGLVRRVVEEGLEVDGLEDRKSTRL